MKFSNLNIPVSDATKPKIVPVNTLNRKTSNKYPCRDPYILLYDNKYYFYQGAGSNGVICSVSDDLENWSDPINVLPIPENFHGIKDMFWAPECHYYKGHFYIFSSVFSSKTNHRCVSVYRADNPLGPFVDIADGCICPKDWDTIDGTLYVDKKGQPWMIFVHEWTSMPDHNGGMCAAKLSEDFTHFISEPIELFRAKDRGEGYNGVTDGPYMYEDKNGHLMMIWSNMYHGLGYFVAVVHSETDTMEGPWTHQEEFLYCKDLRPDFTIDGGHAMILNDKDGVTKILMHGPNGKKKDEDGNIIDFEHLLIYDIIEENGTIKIK